MGLEHETGRVYSGMITRVNFKAEKPFILNLSEQILNKEEEEDKENEEDKEDDNINREEDDNNNREEEVARISNMTFSAQ